MSLELNVNAQVFATKCHSGQFRRDGVTAYINHPARVVDRLTRQGSAAYSFTIAVAWLHDAIEDSNAPHMTAMQICAEFPAEVYLAVATLTKLKDQPYEIYLERVKANPIARLVKIADILDNLSDDPSEKQIIKYSKALLYLHDAT